jgi:hypothetical protein
MPTVAFADELPGYLFSVSRDPDKAVRTSVMLRMNSAD